jgi:hypothetical protein
MFQVLNKPIPELILLLGLEVPLPPDLSLSGIQSDSVTLHWTKPTGHTPDVTYHVQANGIKVAETTKLESVITIAGLRPSNFYSIRVVAINASHFRAESRAILIKTLPEHGLAAVKSATVYGGYPRSPSSTPRADSQDEVQSARSRSSSATEAVISMPNTMVMSRGDGNGKRTVNGHRASIGAGGDAPIAGLTYRNVPDTASESDLSIRQLTEELEVLRRETGEIQKLAGQEHAHP